MIFLFKQVIFRFHVNVPGCTKNVNNLGVAISGWGVEPYWFFWATYVAVECPAMIYDDMKKWYDKWWSMKIYDDWWSTIIYDICSVIFWQTSAVSYLFYFPNFRLHQIGILHPSWNFSGSTSLDRLFSKARNDSPGATGDCPSSCWKRRITLGPNSDCPEPVGPKVKSWLGVFFWDLWHLLGLDWTVSFLGTPCLESNLEHLQKLECLPSWGIDFQKNLSLSHVFLKLPFHLLAILGVDSSCQNCFFHSSFPELLPFFL